MAQQAKVLAAKCASLSLMPRSCTVDERTFFCNLSSELHMHIMACATSTLLPGKAHMHSPHTCTQMYINTYTQIHIHTTHRYTYTCISWNYLTFAVLDFSCISGIIISLTYFISILYYIQVYTHVHNSLHTHRDSTRHKDSHFVRTQEKTVSFS